jgi:uncharacterized protein YjbJ (UPF0337 family)
MFEATSSGTTEDDKRPRGAHQRAGVNVTDKHIDKAKGRAKEAAGALTADKRLKNEGRLDQAKGSIKDAADRAADALTGTPSTSRRRAPK